MSTIYLQNDSKCLSSPSVTIATSSGLGNSLATTWNSENLLESVMNYRPKSFEHHGHRDVHCNDDYAKFNNGDFISKYNEYTSKLSRNSFGERSLLGTEESLLGMGGSIDLYREKDEEDWDSELEGDDFDC